MTDLSSNRIGEENKPRFWTLAILSLSPPRPQLSVSPCLPTPHNLFFTRSKSSHLWTDLHVCLQKSHSSLVSLTPITCVCQHCTAAAAPLIQFRTKLEGEGEGELQLFPLSLSLFPSAESLSVIVAHVAAAALSPPPPILGWDSPSTLPVSFGAGLFAKSQRSCSLYHLKHLHISLHIKGKICSEETLAT